MSRCDRCRGGLKLVYVKASDVLKAMKDANIVIIKDDDFLNAIFRQMFREFDIAQLKLYGDEELAVTVCMECGFIIPCGIYGVPKLMDPKKEYMCVFCGAD